MCIRDRCYEVPEGSRQSKGMNIANLLPIAADEKVTYMIRVPEFDEEKYLVMVTKQGIIKRISLNAYNTARKCGLIALEPVSYTHLVSVLVLLAL